MLSQHNRTKFLCTNRDSFENLRNQVAKKTVGQQNYKHYIKKLTHITGSYDLHAIESWPILGADRSFVHVANKHPLFDSLNAVIATSFYKDFLYNT